MRFSEKAMEIIFEPYAIFLVSSCPEPYEAKLKALHSPTNPECV